MAAVEESARNIKITVQSKTNPEMNTVFGWIFEYCCYIFWEEFQENFTVDSASERRLLEGIPMYSVESTTSRNRLAHFVSLLTRLADGLEYNIEYDEVESDDFGTPLEGAIDILHTFLDSLEVVTEGEALHNLELDIQTEAVLVCCRAGDYDTARVVFQRLWAGKNLTKAQQRVKSTLDKALKTESVEELPSKLTWENFQKRTIENLRTLYDDIEVDEPFLHKAARRFLDASRRRSSSIATQSQDNETNSRVIPLGRLQAVSKKLGCGSLEDLNVNDIKENKRPTKSAPKKTPDKKLSNPPVSPIGVNNNDDEELTDNSDIEMVTSTPHPDSVKENNSSKKDRPSTSKDSNPWRERPIKERQAKQKEDIHNKENDSPKRGKPIRHHLYQPGRSTRYKTTPSNGNAAKSKYIEWSSSDEEGEDKPNIFTTQLPHKRVRISLDLEDGPLQYHRIRKPAQRVPWTSEEEETLRKGVAKYGKGNWAVIKDKYGFVLRTSVNLKDKWRNLEKIAQTGGGGDS